MGAADIFALTIAIAGLIVWVASPMLEVRRLDREARERRERIRLSCWEREQRPGWNRTRW